MVMFDALKVMKRIESIQSNLPMESCEHRRWYLLQHCEHDLIVNGVMILSTEKLIIDLWAIRLFDILFSLRVTLSEKQEATKTWTFFSSIG